MCRIVIPQPLRHAMFNLIHTSPISGYMGEYKTLYHIRIRFFLFRLCSGVANWMNNCQYCALTYRWRQRGQGLIFSWPVSCLFSIIYFDLWIPSHFINRNIYIGSHERQV